MKIQIKTELGCSKYCAHNKYRPNLVNYVTWKYWLLVSLSFNTWIIEWTFDHLVFVSWRGLGCYIRFLLSANQFILVVFFCQFHKGRSNTVWAPFAGPSSQTQNQMHRRICASSNNEPTISLILIWIRHTILMVLLDKVTDVMIVVVRRQDDICVHYRT